MDRRLVKSIHHHRCFQAPEMKKVVEEYVSTEFPVSRAMRLSEVGAEHCVCLSSSRLCLASSLTLSTVPYLSPVQESVQTSVYLLRGRYQHILSLCDKNALSPVVNTSLLSEDLFCKQPLQMSLCLSSSLSETWCWASAALSQE